MDFQEDLFDAKIEIAAEQLAIQKLQDPKYLQGTIQRLLAEQEEKDKYIAIIEPKAARHDAWLDSEGYFGCARVSEKLRIPYITPGGKIDTMGEKKFCQALAYLSVIIKEGNGYRVSKAWYKYAKAFPKPDSRGINHWSVKFSPDGVDKLADLFESKTGVWESTGIGGVMHHE